MAIYQIGLVGQAMPLEVELPFDELAELAAQASGTRFLTGHMTEPDEQGVYRQVMIATGRIQCVIEAG